MDKDNHSCPSGCLGLILLKRDLGVESPRKEEKKGDQNTIDFGIDPKVSAHSWNLQSRITASA
jgi:hypothetical protein